MIKKILKIIIPIIVLLLLLFIINFIRNYHILNQIEKQNAAIESSTDNYYFEHITETEPYTYKEEIYVYNGAYIVKDYMNDELYKTIWFDLSSGKSVSIDNNNNLSQNVDYTSFQREYKEILLIKQDSKKETLRKLLISNLFKPIQKENESYIIKKDDNKIYVNENTGLIEKEVSDKSTQTYKLEQNITSENDVKRPIKQEE